MSEQLSFTYTSIGNIARLFCTILVEKKYDSRMIYIWHEMFDREGSDELFENFLLKAYPEGCTVGEDTLPKIIEVAMNYLKTNDEAIRITAEYDYFNYDSCVWSLYDNQVYPVPFGNHENAVTKLCVEFFKGCEDTIESVDVKNFILKNFKVKSSNSSLETIAKDYRYVKDCIKFGIVQ